MPSLEKAAGTNADTLENILNVDGNEEHKAQDQGPSEEQKVIDQNACPIGGQEQEATTASTIET